MRHLRIPPAAEIDTERVAYGITFLRSLLCLREGNPTATLVQFRSDPLRGPAGRGWAARARGRLIGRCRRTEGMRNTQQGVGCGIRFIAAD